MQHNPRNTRRKLFASLSVLTVVFTVAAIAQFTGAFPKNPPVTKAAERNVTPDQPRAVFGGFSRSYASRGARLQKSSPRKKSRVPGQKRSLHRPWTDRGTARQVADTFARGDVNGQTILYAPKMETFYQRNGVSRETVRREKSRMMELYPKVHRYDISDLKFESQKHDEAVVSFRKDWDMNGDRRFAGAERQRLKLRRINGDWKMSAKRKCKSTGSNGASSEQSWCVQTIAPRLPHRRKYRTK